ncbi:hypothetical protein BH10PSE13_BH10PSE13_13580 [soil metagenome]
MGLFSHFSNGARPAIRTILIVEDEPLVAFENEHALAHAGYRVVDTVDRCKHALEAMVAGGIDLVVADIALPGEGSGLDVARGALAHGIPVLFVTGYCPPEARDLALGWLAKPYASRDLVRAIGVVERLLAGQSAEILPGAMTLF